MAITQNHDIATAIDEAHLDVRRLVAGKSVAIKPNATWASQEDKTGVTQPDTLRAVLRHVKRFNPIPARVCSGRPPAPGSVG